MIAEPLDELLGRLRQGDAAAAEQVFLTYEPYLRRVVRRRLSPSLRAKFDSSDIVQSVWVDLLRGFRQGSWSFPTAGHLRAFLVKATCNRLIDRARQNQPACGRFETGLDLAAGCEPASPDPRPSQVAQARDLWERLLAICPPQHQELVRLRREGLLLHEIATRTGLHEGSIRRILRGLARQLAFEPGI